MIGVARKLSWLYRKRRFRQLLVNHREAWDAVVTGRPGVELQLRDGTTVSCGPSDNVATILSEVWVDKCYSPAWLKVPRGGTVVDIGANVGVAALFFARQYSCNSVICFEPHPETFSFLQRNVLRNRLEDVIVAHNLAVFEAAIPQLALASSLSDSGSSIFQPDGGGLSVPAIGLEDCIAKAGGAQIELLKIDTEGAEDKIIGETTYGMEDIRRVALEYHSLEKRDRVAERLKRRGFRVKAKATPWYEDHLGMMWAER